MAVPCTSNNNWMNNEKCSNKRVQNKSPNRSHRQQNSQLVKRSGRRLLPKQQRRQRQRQRRLKNKIFNLRISREFRFIQSVYTVRNIPNKIRKTASKYGKEILAFVWFTRFSWICRMWLFHVVLLWPFVNGKEMNKLLRTLYTATVLVAVTVKLGTH